MTMKGGVWLIVICAPLVCASVKRSRAIAGELELFLDPWRVPEFARHLAESPDSVTPFRRVHLLVFSNGQTLGETKVSPFAQAPAWQDADILKRLTESCRRAGVKCFWAVDLLEWERRGVESSGLYAGHLELFEVDLSGSPGDADSTRYASPFHPDVRAALKSLIEEVATHDPQPDGVTISCRLPADRLLGFSTAAREACVNAEGIDPQDLRDDEFGTYGRWRMEYLTGMMRELVDEYHKHRPDAPVMVRGTGDQYAKSPKRRIRSADHWMQWMQEGMVSEVLLDADWTVGDNQVIWPMLYQLINRLRDEPQKAGNLAGLLERLHPMVPSRSDKGLPNLDKQIEGLENQGGTTTGAVFWPVVDEDWPLVLETAKKLVEGQNEQ